MTRPEYSVAICVFHFAGSSGEWEHAKLTAFLFVQDHKDRFLTQGCAIALGWGEVPPPVPYRQWKVVPYCRTVIKIEIGERGRKSRKKGVEMTVTLNRLCQLHFRYFNDANDYAAQQLPGKEYLV
jgi:hypothetical protein